MDNFVAIQDNKGGVALLNEGLKASEYHDDDNQTLSLTVLSCYQLRICITNLEMTDYSSQDNGSQCLGTHTFKYAFIPYSRSIETAKLWQAAERYKHASAWLRLAHRRMASYRWHTLS
jgi:alpha-mannosidase